ncbi:MAG: glycosyltransferase [Acidobacteriota bacterium]
MIIPVYNGRGFIRDAIRSVLEQPCPVELIVVDDGSTDGTADEASACGSGVCVIRSRHNEGLPSALNRGLESAHGDVVGFLDSDDVWSPRRLTPEVALFSDMPDIEVLWGRTRIVFPSGENAGGAESPDWPPQFFPALGSMLFRRSVFERVGRFDPGLRHAQDIDFLARAMEARCDVRRHQNVVLTWRRHATNMTNEVGLDRDYLATAVRMALHRRRGLASQRRMR